MQSQGRKYSVAPVDLSSKKDVQRELQELYILQRGIITSYRSWAHEFVNYNGFSTDARQMQQNLKQCNDDYTVQMLTSCASGLRNGLTIPSLIGSIFTHKMAKAMNPEFDQDVSRLYLNWATQFKDVRPRGLMGKFKRSAEDFALKASVDLEHNSILSHMSNNTLDEMVMTPRQIAALKMNFMEQYYVDVRSCDIHSKDGCTEISKLTEEYNKALDHLNVIANNSGFDMSVVAEEERYLVGLKLQDDPSYANVFNETSNMFGVFPISDDDNFFSGSFETYDNHEYTVGGSELKYGAFTPRLPFGVDSRGRLMKSDKEREAELKENWLFFAKDCAAMENYIDTSCPCSRKTKAEARKLLEDKREKFMGQSIDMLMSDFGMSQRAAKNFVKKNFELQFDYYKQHGVTGSANVNHDYGFDQDRFNDEVNFAVDKQVMSYYAEDGIKPVFRTAVVEDKFKDSVPSDMYEAIEADYKDRMDKLYTRLEDVASRHFGPKEKRSGREILADMRNNYVGSMNGEELFNLMMRAGNNVSQGYFSKNQMCGVRVYSKSDLSAGNNSKHKTQQRMQDFHQVFPDLDNTEEEYDIVPTV